MIVGFAIAMKLDAREIHDHITLAVLLYVGFLANYAQGTQEQLRVMKGSVVVEVNFQS